MKTITLVLPTLNEKDAIEDFIKEVFAQEKNLPGYKLDIVVSDSHSSDGTVEIVKKLQKNNPRLHLIEVGYGLGVGLIEGHKFALEYLKPDILVQLDADGQVDVEVLPRLVKVIEQGYELAIGSRFAEGGKNNLSLSRRIFSWGSCLLSRVIMGPLDIGEFNNSARAFTPGLFQRINLQRLPWKEKTFIIQPAFLNEAILAGATYKEVPLVFKNRAEGYSKNKVLNYSYDVMTYVIDARLRKWGLTIPFFLWTHKIKTIVKFSMVGVIGTVVDLFFYKFFINKYHFAPATAKAFSTEFGIINNFLFNNFWTFRHRKTSTNIFHRFVIYNLVSFGGLVIAVSIVKLLYSVYGEGTIRLGVINIAYNTIYFFATIPLVMAWNFTINHFFTWKHQSKN